MGKYFAPTRHGVVKLRRKFDMFDPLSDHRQTGNQCHAGCKTLGAWVGIKANVVGILVMSRFCQNVLERGLRENFLQADHIGVHQVKLVRDPAGFRVVLLPGVRF